MADIELREKQRRADACDRQAQLDLINMRVRAGEIPPSLIDSTTEALQLAAYAGHVDARMILGDPWLSGLPKPIASI